MKYSELVEVYSKLEATTKRLEKTSILSEFLKSTSDEYALLLVQGKVFPNWDDRVLGMASKLVLKAISTATGASAEKIQKSWRKSGDLGTVASELTVRKTQATLFSKELTVRKVFDNLHKLAEMEGAGTVDRKVQLVAELLTSAKPEEAKYIVRTIIGELRIGLGEGTIRDAIVWAFFGKDAGIIYDEKENKIDFKEDRKMYEHYLHVVQKAIDRRNDFVEVALLAKKGEKALSDVSLQPGRPVKVMLYQKALDIEDGFKTVGEPAALEYKYDGFRLQIHNESGKISLFTRRLEDVTKQFPDVVDYVKKVKGSSFILDAEVIGIDTKTGKYLPFQAISQRIKRKYDIESMAKKFPVEVNVFDVLSYEGKSMIKIHFAERRKILEGCIPDTKGIKLATQLVTSSAKDAKKFYDKSLAAGNEGIMMKNLESVYKPGSRVGYGVKVKPTMDTLEVVITGAQWGEGKRGKWLASFIIAVRDPGDGKFLEIGKVGTGIKEKSEEGVSFAQLTDMLKPLVFEEKDRVVSVKPKVIIEVDYEEIQKSPTYKSGFALRFPRLVRLREDRGPDDISTIDEVKKLYKHQRARNK